MAFNLHNNIIHMGWSKEGDDNSSTFNIFCVTNFQLFKFLSFASRSIQGLFKKNVYPSFDVLILIPKFLKIFGVQFAYLD